MIADRQVLVQAARAALRATLLGGLSLAGLWGASVHAAPLPEAARQEVHALLGRLESSGCKFRRNGSWYSATESKDHLLRKLDYLEKKASITTTEAFLEAAASRSSMSGVEYQVQCADNAAQPSAAWLTQQLQQLRQAAKH